VLQFDETKKESFMVAHFAPLFYLLLVFGVEMKRVYFWVNKK